MEFHTKAANMTTEELEGYAVDFHSKWLGSCMGGTMQRAFLLSEAVIILSRKHKKLNEQLQIMQETGNGK